MGRSWEEVWRGAKEGGRQALCGPLSPLSLTCHPNVHSSADVYVQGRASPHSHPHPRCQSWGPQAPLSAPRPSPAEPPHSSPSPQFSLHFVASFAGLVSTEGW